MQALAVRGCAATRVSRQGCACEGPRHRWSGLIACGGKRSRLARSNQHHGEARAQAPLHLSALTIPPMTLRLERVLPARPILGRYGPFWRSRAEIWRETGLRAMSKVTTAVLASCLLGASLPACSLNDPSAKDFTQMNQRPEKAKETGNTIDAAETACKAETQTRASPRSPPSFPGCARALPMRTTSPA